MEASWAMRIVIVNEEMDKLRAVNNLLVGMSMRPILPEQEAEMPMRILIVDDVAENIRVLSGILAGTGVEISTATSGRRALKIAEHFPPDLVLLDVMMPEMDGYEVCKAMKADPLLRGIPIIFITALADEAAEIKGLELGAVDYISKPFKDVIVKLRIKTQLELKRQREFLENLSRIDGLTKIPNRRAFDERFDLEWRRSERSAQTLALLLVDVDFFKGYNDTYGHMAGDECLCKIATALYESVNRAGDFVARYGGEEFVALLPVNDPDDMPTIAERLRANIEALAIPHGASTASDCVTISIGGAQFIPNPEADPKAILELADKQLYLAKSSGRNQIKLAAGTN
jgi:diguanylate cyclase (GGDEF)-like protein